MRVALNYLSPGESPIAGPRGRSSSLRDEVVVDLGVCQRDLPMTAVSLALVLVTVPWLNHSWCVASR
jgi:hypothetical protein